MNRFSSTWRGAWAAVVCICWVALLARGAHAQVDEEGNTRIGRLRLTPVIASLQKESGKHIALAEGRWRASTGETGLERVVPAWPGIDALVAAGAVLYLNDEEMIAREVLVNSQISICDAVFDGTYLWLSCRGAPGVYVLDKDGRTVAHFDAASSLPVTGSPALCAIERGKVLAAGGPGWVALLELPGGKPACRMLYEARKAKKVTPANPMTDLTMQFHPEWIVTYSEESGRGRRWAFIDRNTNPLMVDLDSLAVMCYPMPDAGGRESFPRRDGPASAFLSDGGLLYVAGSQGDFRIYRLNPQTLRLQEAIQRRGAEWHWGNAMAGSVAKSEGWVYYVGSQRWLRYAPASGTTEVLATTGSGEPWRLAVSQQLGLIGMRGGSIFQVSVEP